MASAENAKQKHFLSALHIAVFAVAVTVQAFKEDLRKLKISSRTIFLRSVYPVLPTLSQIPPPKTRSSRVFGSVTAHRSIALFQVFTALCTCLSHRFSSL
jgi:hypothetical protein